jgi:hypothetical protein
MIASTKGNNSIITRKENINIFDSRKDILKIHLLFISISYNKTRTYTTTTYIELIPKESSSNVLIVCCITCGAIISCQDITFKNRYYQITTLPH